MPDFAGSFPHHVNNIMLIYCKRTVIKKICLISLSQQGVTKVTTAYTYDEARSTVPSLEKNGVEERNRRFGGSRRTVEKLLK